MWLSIACVVITVPLAVAAETGPSDLDMGEWAFAGFVPGFVVSGWWLTQRRPRMAIGWLFLVAGATAAIAALTGTYAGASYVRGWPGTAWSMWVFSWMWQPHSNLLAIAFVVFPDGHARHRWHRATVWLLAGLSATGMLVSVVRPGVIVGTPNHPDGTFPGVVNPVGIDSLAQLTESASDVLLAVGFVAFLLPIVVTSIGWARSADVRRRQYRWATLLQVVGVVASALVLGLPGSLGVSLIILQTMATQLLVVVAILQWRAFDVDVVVRRSLLAGAVLAGALGVYAVVVTVVSVAVGNDGRVPSLVGVGAVVVTVAPVALAARTVVNRAFYGRRGDPYAVVAEVGRRASAASAPAEALADTVAAITQELKLPYAAILDLDGTELAASGTAVAPPERVDLPLEHLGDTVGSLRIGHRRGESELSAAEQQLLSTLAHQVGASVHALHLVEGLRAAREQLVVAREDERRRIQRDLHDGLGPQLTAVTMHLDAARNHLAAGNPVDTDELLRDARRELHHAGGDVRRLVYSLGDPSIASRGLPSAVDSQVRLLTQATGIEAEIDLQPLPPLTAATEEAIHRILSEAVTNVVRHARASRCRVALWAEGGHVMGSVTDDGVGLAPDARPGVGTRSFRDRADELGGTVAVGPGPAGGTEVRLVLPIGPA